MIKLFFVFVFSIFSCQDQSLEFESFTGPEQSEEIGLVEAFPNLEFQRPVDLQGAADQTNRIFVVEQEGVISVFENESGVKEKTIFLDINASVDDKSNEEGLLGLAFHPNYSENGFFFLNYTVSTSETVIARYTVSGSDPNKADPTSERIIMKYKQPHGNHNGGQVAFGPDGYLYISIGDGGSGGDPHGNGQNKSTILGTILRVDVDNEENGLNYAIPVDNPFAESNSFKREIYAYGLRNPWRISFDSETGKLWCADVGQNKFEEVNIIENGKNYGWNIMEGFHTFKDNQSDQSNLTLPIWEIAQSTGDHSITGGFVYRGSLAPSLTGKYIYGDFVSGRVYALMLGADGKAQNTELMDSNLAIASFGTDDKQELYICAFDGKIYRFKE